jgi:hypothetical protein
MSLSPKPGSRERSHEFNRNFRFASPISTPHLDQPASLGKVLAQFWSTVPPAAPGWVGLASRGHATPGNAVCLIDSADTSPSPHLVIKICCAPRAAYPAGRHNPAQHAAKQPPRQVALWEHAAKDRGVTARGCERASRAPRMRLRIRLVRAAMAEAAGKIEGRYPVFDEVVLMTTCSDDQGRQIRCYQPTRSDRGFRRRAGLRTGSIGVDFFISVSF